MLTITPNAASILSKTRAEKGGDCQENAEEPELCNAPTEHAGRVDGPKRKDRGAPIRVKHARKQKQRNVPMGPQ